jgi:HK97 gp10 family phage protein
VSDGVIVGTNIEYAKYLEYGTSKMQARPFLLPALNRMKDQLMNIIAGK